MKAAPAVGFPYRSSRALFVAVAGVAVAAVVAVSISAAPRWLQLGLMLGICACTGVALGGLLRPRVRTLVWRSDGGVDLELRDGVRDARRDAVGAVRAARVLGPLIALTVCWPQHGRTTLWLLPDNLGADDRRRLRMRLAATRSRRASETTDTP